MLATQYLEVWNKCDLLEDKDKFELDNIDLLYPSKSELEKGASPPLLVSCEDNYNIDELLDSIAKLSITSMGKAYYTLRYPGEDHFKRINWLNVHASLSQDTEFAYHEDGSIQIEALIDEVTYQRYLKEFEPDLFEQERELRKEQKRRGMPPPGWADS